MADGEIDGFTAFRAARKANAEPKGDGPPVRAAAEGKTKRGEAPGSRIGRTAMPTGKAIVCYHCEHAFTIVGAQANTMCPACKEWLDVKDITVNRGNWSQDVVTAGSLVINTMGVVTGGVVVANRVVLKGKVEGGEIYATHQLEVHKNALLNLDHVTARDLVIQKGASFEVDEGLLDRFHNIELHGALTGIIRPTGKLTIHPSGYFTGSVEAASVDVKPGGILEASCRLTGELRSPAIRSKPKIPKPSKTSNTPAAKEAAAKRKAITSQSTAAASTAAKPAVPPTEKTPTKKAGPAATTSPPEKTPSTPKKATSKKAAAKKTTAKKPATKPEGGEEAAINNMTAKKRAAKKKTAKKKSSKTVPTKKTAKKKSPKKVPTKKTATKKAPTKKAPPQE